MRRTLATLGLMLAMAPVALALTDCIPAGQTQDIRLPLPAIGPGSGSGLPTSAQWLSSDVTVWDRDFWSPNDPVPDNGVVGNSVSVSITSTGGKLADASGNIIDSGLEGDCIELFYTRPYAYTGSTSLCIKLSSGGVGATHCVETEISIKATYVSPSFEVCPC